MKKKSLGILVALLLVVGAGVYTYARYTSSFTGTGSAQVAKWAVKVNDSVTDTFDLDLSLSANTNVADNRIAPGRTATAQLILDLTGTEVATDYEIDLSGVTGLPDGMKITSVKATVAGGQATELNGSNGKYTGSVALADVAKPITFDITVAWENDEANNENDTTVGEAAGELSIPVTVTAKQHIG